MTPDAPGDDGVQRQLQRSILRELRAVADPVEMRRVVHCLVLNELSDVAGRGIGQRVSPGGALGRLALRQRELAFELDAPRIGDVVLPAHMHEDWNDWPGDGQERRTPGR